MLKSERQLTLRCATYLTCYMKRYCGQLTRVIIKRAKKEEPLCWNYLLAPRLWATARDLRFDYIAVDFSKRSKKCFLARHPDGSFIENVWMWPTESAILSMSFQDCSCNERTAIMSAVGAHACILPNIFHFDVSYFRSIWSRPLDMLIVRIPVTRGISSLRIGLDNGWLCYECFDTRVLSEL